MKKNLLILFTAFSFSNLLAQSNLFLDNSYTVEEMVMDFFDDPNIVISNVTHTGDASSIAFFDGGDTDLGLSAGIVFCTGEIQSVIGPNSGGNVSGFTDIGGDLDIEQMTNFASYDALVIEFDFAVSISDTLDFNYVFGSEEYPEWAGTAFNDAFGFLLSGPGINGSFSNNATNIAMIPNSTEPVTINNVNPSINSQFYVDNMDGTHLEYDGFTTPLPASFEAIAGETYHIKIVVSDVADAQLDSGIFLSFNSLGQNDSLVPPTGFDFIVASGTNTVEFVNESKYARSWSWDFGNGMTSTERNPGPITYATPGTYTVTLTTENYCCTETYSTTIDVGIVQIAVNTIVNPVTCFGGSDGSIQIEITGGQAPYDIQPPLSELMDLSAGNYLVNIADANGVATSMVIEITEPDLLTVIPTTFPDGTVVLEAEGGTPPYMFNWSNGATGNELNNLQSGDYTITLTDANVCTSIIELTLDIMSGINDLKDFEMQIYPNPVTDQFRVEWIARANIEKIEIFDMLGRAVSFTQEYLSNGVNILLEKKMTQGTYFLKVELENGKQSFERFVKL